MASKIPGDSAHEETEATTIRIFTSHDVANLAAASLKAHGIECWLEADDAGGMLPNLTTSAGVRLSVRASDAGAASALLTDQELGGEIPNQDDRETKVWTSNSAVCPGSTK